MNSRISRAVLTIVALYTVASLLGCAQQTDSPAESSPRGPSADISLQVADADAFRKVLSDSRGRVVLVDFWATWCVPCVEHFPDTVELHRRLHQRGLAVITVSLDDPTDEANVRSFLTQQRANFVNLLSEYGGGSAALEAFSLPGAVPFYRVYDRAGELRHEFSIDPHAKRQFTLEDIEAVITKYL